MTIGLWALTLILVVLAFLLLVSAAIFCAAFVRFPKRAEEKLEAREDPEPLINEGVRWIREQNCKKVEIRSYDGLRLAARVLPAENAKGTLILIHGYRSPMYHDFSCILPFYHALGYNLLIPSQRTHGESEGKYICYGIRERYDCKAWAAFAESYFEPGGDIFLGGVSMGSATVLMASDLTLPDTVRGIIADCGFTSPYEEFVYLLKRSHVPIHPLMDLVALYARLFAGYRFRDCSTLTCVSDTKLPILFVHGREDHTVPFFNGTRLHKLYQGPKDFLFVDGARHVESMYMDPAGYAQKLDHMMETYFYGI